MLKSVVTKKEQRGGLKLTDFRLLENRYDSKIIDGKYSNRHHVASFVGYFPASDPKVVITVVVDEPKMKNGLLGYGGLVAAPAFQRVGKGIIS